MTFKFVCLTTMYIKIKVELQNSGTVTKLNFNTFFQFNHREQTFLSRVKPKNKYTRSIQLTTKTSILLVKNYFTSASPPPPEKEKKFYLFESQFLICNPTLKNVLSRL